MSIAVEIQRFGTSVSQKPLIVLFLGVFAPLSVIPCWDVLSIEGEGGKIVTAVADCHRSSYP